MAHFPMFINLEGRTVLIVGTGKHVREKEEKLALFQCRLSYASTESFLPELLEEEPAMVILCDRHHPRNREIADLCRARHIPVNAVDDPPLCDFQFPALTRRGCMTVAISTDGKAPAVGRLIREELESRLPDQTEEILEWSAGLTQQLRIRVPDYHQRAALLNRILREAFRLGRPLEESEWTML